MESGIHEPERSDASGRASTPERSARSGGPLGLSTRTWGAGVAAGLVGGLAMGLALDTAPGTFAVIGSLYGQPSALAGWVAHLVHSVLFALAFVVVVRRTRLREYSRTTAGVTALATAYGGLLAVTAGAFVMPLWLNAVAAAGAPVPNLTTLGVVSHLLYGVVLGWGYALVREAEEPAPEREPESVRTGQPSGRGATVDVESPRDRRADDRSEAEVAVSPDANGDRPRPPRVD